MKRCTGNIAGQNSTLHYLDSGLKSPFLNQSGIVIELLGLHTEVIDFFSEKYQWVTEL